MLEKKRELAMRKIFAATSAVILSIPLKVGPALAQPRDWGAGPWGMHYMWGSLGMGMMFFMFIFWILIMAGVVALIRWLWRPESGSRGAAGGAETAEDILKTWFARCGIDEEEFKSKLQALKSSQTR